MDHPVKRYPRDVRNAVLRRLPTGRGLTVLQWAVTKRTRQDIPFVGKAISGGWKPALPESAVAEIEAAWWPLMKCLGYEPVTDAHKWARPLMNADICEALSPVVKTVA